MKPEHVLIDSTGHCKIVDFGLSATLSETNKKSFTNCGTNVYVAPEVLKSIGTSYKADCWSLGVLMHEILSGETPFYDENPVTLHENVITCKPTYASCITLG